MIKFICAGLLISIMGLSACGFGVAQSSPEGQALSENQLPSEDQASPENKTPSVKMTAETLKTLIKKFDEKAVAKANGVTFTLNERDLFMVYDEKADRMRIITPIAPSGIATEEVLIRMMQANYDAVLDARYAMANDILWAVFIHPLSSLTQDNFLSGVAQTVTAAETFGTSFTSGAVVFGGGDSSAIHKDLLKELEKATAKGKEI